jgi:hypothetical protein
LNIDDIRNPERRSGFDHVSSPAPGRWRAQAGARPRQAGQQTSSWQGPYRVTPEDAAQDYVNMVNLGAAAPGGARRVRTAFRTARHPRRRRDLTPAEKVARDIARDATADIDRPGWVYLIGEGNDPTQSGSFVKIGWTASDPPEARLGDYQTGNPRRLTMIAAVPGTKDDEHRLQDRFSHDQILGEWFRISFALKAAFDVR